MFDTVTARYILRYSIHYADKYEGIVSRIQG